MEKYLALAAMYESLFLQIFQHFRMNEKQLFFSLMSFSEAFKKLLRLPVLSPTTGEDPQDI